MQDNFFHKVYAIVCQIPEGKVSTYGAIGKYLGSAKSARMVGWALNKCPSDVPVHRVVNKQGLLTGKMHFDGITLMQDLLENIMHPSSIPFRVPSVPKDIYEEIEADIKECCYEHGLTVEIYMDSPIKGGDGNREFLLVATKD